MKISGGTIGSNGSQGATTVITNESKTSRYQDPVDKRTPFDKIVDGSSLIAAMQLSIEPDALFILNEDEHVTDTQTNIVLTGSGQITYGIADAALKTACYEFEDGQGGRLAAPNNSYLDSTTTGIFILVVSRLIQTPNGNRILASKKSTNGYAVKVNSSGHVYWEIKASAGSTKTATVAVNHYDGSGTDAFTALCVNDITNNDFQIWTNLGSGSLGTAETLSLTEATDFRIATHASPAAGARTAIVAVWIGDARVNDTHRANLHTFLELP